MQITWVHTSVGYLILQNRCTHKLYSKFYTAALQFQGHAAEGIALQLRLLACLCVCVCVLECVCVCM
jgi:hypothetical protein